MQYRYVIRRSQIGSNDPKITHYDFKVCFGNEKTHSQLHLGDDHHAVLLIRK